MVLAMVVELRLYLWVRFEFAFILCKDDLIGKGDNVAQKGQKGRERKDEIQSIDVKNITLQIKNIKNMLFQFYKKNIKKTCIKTLNNSIHSSNKHRQYESNKVNNTATKHSLCPGNGSGSAIPGVHHSRGPPFPEGRYLVLPSSEYGNIKILPVTLN